MSYINGYVDYSTVRMNKIFIIALMINKQTQCHVTLDDVIFEEIEWE